MPTRREFLKLGAGTGAALFVPIRMGAGVRVAPNRLPSPPLRRWVDPVPKPRVLQPSAYDGSMPVYAVSVSEFTQQLHSDLPPTRLWGYDGSYPGPTIEARRDEPIRVVWSNALGTGPHLLPVDRTLHGTNMLEPDRRITTHLHGGIVPPESDGFPEDWFTDGGSAVFEYPNVQRATTLWYHDHSLGITRLNVQAGMAAFYLLRDEEEDGLIEEGLPSGDYEIALAIQDRSFNEDGSLFYPDTGVTDEHPVWVPEFFGDVPVVNGVAWPALHVEPRRYRLRLLNGCNARFLNLSLLEYDAGHYRGAGPAPILIGTDGGLLPAAVPLARPGGATPARFLIAPAERLDMIIDFSAFAGRELILHNNATAPFAGSAPGNARPPAHRHGHPIGADLSEIMLIRVSSGAVQDPSTVPAVPSASFERLDASAATVVRQITLEEVTDEDDTPLEALLQGRHWDDPITESRALGSTEIWQLINLTGDTHPIHLHLDHFQVLWRRRFDEERYEQQGQPIRWQGPAIPPGPAEAGWKDTVAAHPGEVCAIVVRSDSFTGEYPYHCHILEHEDNEMMLRFEVT